MSGKKTVSKAIINILSAEWPVPAKKIHNVLRLYGYDVSHQAVYKALKELMENEMVKKTPEGFKISKEWIKNVKDYVNLVEANYFKNNNPNELENLIGTKSFVFNSLYDLDKFFLELNKIIAAKKGSPRNIYMHFQHNWWPLFYGKEVHEIEELASSNKKRFVFLCAGRTEIDKWAAGVEEKVGLKIKFGIPCAELSDIEVYEDIVVQIFIPKNTMSLLNNVYKNTKNVLHLNIPELYRKIIKKKSKIIVIASKNKEVAEHIKDQTLSHFKS